MGQVGAVGDEEKLLIYILEGLHALDDSTSASAMGTFPETEEFRGVIPVPRRMNDRRVGDGAA